MISYKASISALLSKLGYLPELDTEINLSKSTIAFLFDN